MSTQTSQSLAASALRAYKWYTQRHDLYGQHDPAQLQLIQPSFERATSRLLTAARLKEEQLRHRWRDKKQRAREQLRAYTARALALAAVWQARGISRGQVTASTPAPILDDVPAGSQDQLPEKQAVTRALTQEQRDTLMGSDGWLRYGIMSGIANLSHAFMHSANSVQVEGGHVMQAALSRPQGQALITVCNHVASLDDPLVMSAIIPTAFYQQPTALRWTLCASDRCFKYAALAPLFTAAKVLPIQRGAGLAQPGMLAAEERLAQGDWVHIFPEGTRSRDPQRMGSVRKGVGRLIAAASTQGGPPPLVVPFVHAGMEGIMPVGSNLPRVGQQVRVVVGQPIPVDDLLASARTAGWSDDALYTAIAHRVEQRLHTMHAAVVRGEATLQADDTCHQPAAHDVAGEAGSSSGVVAQATHAALGAWQRYQRSWDTLAFNTWHRVWAGRLAGVQASEAVLYS